MRPARRRRRRWPLLLALVVLLELALQLAAPIVRGWMARADGQPDPGAALTVLCVGDSNVYGLNVPRAWAWPARLAADLAPRYDGPVSVLNRGVPGCNTAQVARDLARDLVDAGPDLVLVLVGVNDTWNTAGEGGLLPWLGRLKLVRLVRVLAAGVTTAGEFAVETDAEGRFRVRRGGRGEPVHTGGAGLARRGEALEESVGHGLDEIVGLCRDHGATVVLLTYPESQGAHGEVNGHLRELARARNLPLIDLEASFAGHFAREGYAVLMFNDHHPNVRGHELVAADVARRLTELQLVAPARPAPAAREPDRPPRLDALGDGWLDLQGPPGWPFQVAVSAAADASGGLLIGDARLPLADDEVLAASRMLPELSGWLGADGRGRVRVSPSLQARAPGADLRACLLLLRESVQPEAASPVAAVSDAVTVRF